MKKILLLSVLAALAAGGYWLYNRYAAGPERALYQAFQATKQHDVAAFERYVDVSSVTGGLIDQIAAQGSLPGLNVRGFALEGALQLLKPRLKEAARNEVDHYVETGSLGANAQGNGLPGISVLGLAGAVVSPDSKLKGIKYVNRQGPQALVGLEFTQPQFDTTMVLELRLLDQGDHWQVKEITNTAALLKQAARREKRTELNR